MPAVDFTEIPPANVGDGSQDTFELFARDFLTALGFEVEEEPCRGPDGGKDLMVREPLTGIVRSTYRCWIVSCKHYAHSGQSIGDSDEIDILGKVRKFKADGFMAFYSTIPSSGLMKTLKSHEDEASVEIWDREKIEGSLVSDARLQTVFERYFPQSHKAWRTYLRTPVQVFGVYEPLECVVCGKDLLIDKKGNIALVINVRENPELVLDFYWACRRQACDGLVTQKAWDEHQAITKWEGLDDLSVPMVYMRWIGSHLTRLHEGREVFTDQAFERFRHAAMCISQLVVKETTPEQWARLQDLTTIPDFLAVCRRTP